LGRDIGTPLDAEVLVEYIRTPDHMRRRDETLWMTGRVKEDWWKRRENDARDKQPELKGGGWSTRTIRVRTTDAASERLVVKTLAVVGYMGRLASGRG
jgi:hypothetical protein